MASRVAVYNMDRHRRSTMVCEAMVAGIAAVGDDPAMIVDHKYAGVEHDACVFYGYTLSLQRIMKDYIAAGRPAVYIDLGYWAREGAHGHHKIVVNDRHPTAYFNRRAHGASRIHTLDVKLQPWRMRGKHILLAGMALKAATIAEHIEFESFERDALEWIRTYSDRKIIYRPKPSCPDSGPIEGTVYSPKEQPLSDVLRDCHAIVTHHSNTAVDGLIAGIPAFCWQGVAVPMSLQDFSRIESPFYPEGRERWLNGISYCQWSLPEMSAGLPWRHLKDEGLIR